MALSTSLIDSLEGYTRDKYELRLDKSKITRLFTSMRPAYTEAEEYFVQKYLMCDEMVAKGMYQDGYGNCLFKIPNEDGSLHQEPYGHAIRIQFTGTGWSANSPLRPL